MSPDDSPRLKKGDLLNTRYAILGYLGGGGFGQVYRGRDVIIGREVAIKLLILPHGGLNAEAKESLLARFRREAQVAAQLHHPNVITIHDIGITEDNQGDPFLVMQLLQGHDLYTELVQGGAMSPERAQGVFLGCLDALGAAHAQGIIHKDLKPENLFLHLPGGARETLTIFDFGISHILQEGRLTMTGQMIGTPGYMAPEYIIRQEVTPAFDVYQMGLIFVESVTAQPMVYNEDPLLCFAAHQRGDLWLPEGLAAGPLGAVLARALVPDPKLRYPDASAFHDALEALDLTGVEATGEPVLLREVVERHHLPFLAAFPASRSARAPDVGKATVRATPAALEAGAASTQVAAAGSPASTQPHAVEAVAASEVISLPPPSLSLPPPSLSLPPGALSMRPRESTGGLTIPPTPSQPPAFQTKPLRAVVDAEVATTRRWGFLLVTGVLGLLGLFFCPLASLVYVGVSWSRGPLAADARSGDAAEAAGVSSDSALPGSTPTRRSPRRAPRR